LAQSLLSRAAKQPFRPVIPAHDQPGRIDDYQPGLQLPEQPKILSYQGLNHLRADAR